MGQADAQDEDLSEVEVSSHKRKRGHRNSLPEDLPRVRVEHDLTAEEKIRTYSPEQRYKIRQSEAKPILDKIRAWLDKAIAKPPVSSSVGTALSYLNNQWSTLVCYIDDGRLRIDNNHTENAIRPFVVGRKNWLFSDTPKGAHASAALYSMIETAKANNLEPYRYLRYIFKELPKAESVEQFEALLPWNVDKDKVNSDSIY